MSYNSWVMYSLCGGKEGGEKREIGEERMEGTGDKTRQVAGRGSTDARARGNKE